MRTPGSAWKFPRRSDPGSTRRMTKQALWSVQVNGQGFPAGVLTRGLSAMPLTDAFRWLSRQGDEHAIERRAFALQDLTYQRERIDIQEERHSRGRSRPHRHAYAARDEEEEVRYISRKYSLSPSNARDFVLASRGELPG